jgi:hypothetical protein
MVHQVRQGVAELVARAIAATGAQRKQRGTAEQRCTVMAAEGRKEEAGDWLWLK